MLTQTGSETQRVRLSKNTFLYDEESTLIASLTERIKAITGLSMVSSESLQVVNYGIGGHYEYHFDHSTDNYDPNTDPHPFFGPDHGNRIATWLNYMSDVQAGRFSNAESALH